MVPSSLTNIETRIIVAFPHAGQNIFDVSWQICARAKHPPYYRKRISDSTQSLSNIKKSLSTIPAIRQTSIADNRRVPARGAEHL